MTDQTNPTTPDEPKPDETFTWTTEGETAEGSHGASSDPAGTAQSAAAGAGATATALLESLREAVDDLAERATPTVREFSARAAELAAVAADRAAPIAKRAGEVTSEASGKLATKSRSWAADVRASLTPDEAPTATADTPAADVPSAPDAENAPIDDTHPA